MPQTPTEDHNFACRINALSREVQAATARLLEPYGVTPAQALMLYELAHGQTSPTVIAQNMAVDASNLSRMIRLLGDRGLLVREVDDANRTRVAVKLTPEGRKLARRIDPHAAVMQDVITGALTDAERRALSRGLTKLTDALRRTRSMRDHPAAG
ncbi:MAG: MarR family transcriptional regulator [Planctomycetota bacterium]